MKTIEVTDEMYSKLIELSNEYVNQDNRATAMPYLFQIREFEKSYDTGCNGDVIFYNDDDGNEYETIEELKENFEDLPEISELYDLNWYHDDWLEENNLTENSYSLEPKYINAFFTAKACKKHIESNHYHYYEPVDYLNHSWRNPEMDLISDFLKTLGTEEREENE